MSRRKIVTWTCDLNPEDGAATRHVLSLDGRTVEIDLCAECLDPIEGYLEGGRPLVRPAPAPGGGRSAAQRRYTREIRLWAVEQGLLDFGSQGRLPGPVIRKYEAAHPQVGEL